MRPVAPMRWSAARRAPVMAKALPMTLRFYRGLSSAMMPLAPALIRRRLKLGKEDPERIGERRPDVVAVVAWSGSGGRGRRRLSRERSGRERQHPPKDASPASM